jgi:hypothetical protein
MTWKEHSIYDCKVSDEGRVRSNGNLLPQNLWGKHYRYVNVKERRTRRPTRMPVHTLVLETFIGPKPKGCDPDHRNKKTNDNRLENLRWLDMVKNRGMRGKLREEEVSLIRKMLPLYPSLQYKTIGKMFKVNGSAIRQIAIGNTYRGVGT